MESSVSTTTTEPLLRDSTAFKEFVKRHDGQAPIVFNDYYGEFAISQKAKQLLWDNESESRKQLVTHHGHRRDSFALMMYQPSRNNLLLAWLVEEKLGCEVNGAESSLAVKWVPESLYPFYHLRDCRGWETPSFDHSIQKRFQAAEATCTLIADIKTAVTDGRHDEALTLLEKMELESLHIMSDIKSSGIASKMVTSIH